MDKVAYLIIRFFLKYSNSCDQRDFLYQAFKYNSISNPLLNVTSPFLLVCSIDVLTLGITEPCY